MMNARGSRYGWLWVLAAGIMTTVACGKTSEDPPGGGGNVAAIQTWDDFIEQLTSRYCQDIADCCSSQGFPTTDCESTLRARVTDDVASISSKLKVRLNGVAAAACIDAYAAVTHACTDHDLYANLEDTCEPMLEGTVALGGACTDSRECAPQAGGAALCSANVCVAAQRPAPLSSAPRGKVGSACARTCGHSPAETLCTGGDPTLGSCWLEDGVVCERGTCVAAPKAGEACGSEALCAREAHCDAGVCVNSLIGGACSDDFQCPPTARCDGIGRVCVPLKENGESCDASDDCLGGQCEEYRSRTWSVARASTCLGDYGSL